MTLDCLSLVVVAGSGDQAQVALLAPAFTYISTAVQQGTAALLQVRCPLL